MSYRRHLRSAAPRPRASRWLTPPPLAPHCFLAVWAVCSPNLAHAADATSAGAVAAPYPTLENISLTWAVADDDNLNGTVAARFRQVGDASFRDALPLFRVPAGERAGHAWPSQHAGSIFGLKPGQTYEIELTLTDPDGGSATESLTVATRPVPREGGVTRLVPVTPASITDALAAAEPGDILELEAGEYDAFQVERSGEDGAPLVIRSATAGGARVNGEVTLSGSHHVLVDGLAISGRIRMNGVLSLAILNCTIQTEEHGIVAWAEGAKNSLIAHNVITGPTNWEAGALGVDGNNLGEGIDITGPGNVIAYNQVSGFRDCISLLEEDEAIEQTSVDIYGNDLSHCADDAIEADYALANVRIYKNRIQDSFMGISSQPALGGPVYFVRNVMYNVIYEAFKLHNESIGNVLLHNTVVKSGDAWAVYTGDAISRSYSRNNVFFGGPGGQYNGYDSGTGSVLELRTADETCSFDWDAFGTTSGYGLLGHLGEAYFEGLTALRANTTEAHAIELALTDFAGPSTIPRDPFTPPELPDLQPAPEGALVDEALALSNINDAFEGTGPDLGAYESGQEPPAYGPEGSLDPTGADGHAGGAGASSSGGASSAGGSSGGNPSGSGSAPSAAGSPSGGNTGSPASCSCELPARSPRAPRGATLLTALALILSTRRKRNAKQAR